MYENDIGKHSWQLHVLVLLKKYHAGDSNMLVHFNTKSIWVINYVLGRKIFPEIVTKSYFYLIWHAAPVLIEVLSVVFVKEGNSGQTYSKRLKTEASAQIMAESDMKQYCHGTNFDP